MAKAPWAIPNIASGSGNSTTSWTATAYEGRVARETTAVYTDTNGMYSRNCHITQAGKPLFITLSNPSGTASNNGGTSNYSARRTGETLTITGRTNAASITYATFSLDAGEVDGSIDITLPGTYTANSATTTNGVEISGDPGAGQGFDFSISVTIPENNSVERTLGVGISITASDGNGNTAVWNIRITQVGVASYLYIGSNNNTQDISITIPADGTPAQSVNVYSNTSWTIS